MFRRVSYSALVPPLFLALAWLALLAGCRQPNVRINEGFSDREMETEYFGAMSPDAFVDRLGEPDEWRNEGEGDNLRMVAVWNCLDGERREVTWRIAHSDETGRQYWRLDDDMREPCGPEFEARD